MFMDRLASAFFLLFLIATNWKQLVPISMLGNSGEVSGLPFPSFAWEGGRQGLLAIDRTVTELPR